MSDPPRDSIADPPAEQKAFSGAVNRLSIAHLLLWTTTTAGVLTMVQASGPGTNASINSPMQGQQLRPIERAQHIAALVFAPVYGAALAAAALAAWRLATRRFGFPINAGHWLLLLIAPLPLVAGANLLRPWGPPEPITSVGGLVLFTLLTILAALLVREPAWWRLTFGLAATGLVCFWMMIGLKLLLGGDSNFLAIFAAPALLGCGGALLAALGSSILDLTAKHQSDVFHWTGVGVLFAFVAYTFVQWAIVAADQF